MLKRITFVQRLKNYKLLLIFNGKEKRIYVCPDMLYDKSEAINQGGSKNAYIENHIEEIKKHTKIQSDRNAR